MLGRLTSDEIDDFLSDQWFGHLGCHADSKTYVVPISFAHTPGRLVGQTKAGLKIDMLRKNPQCCVQVDKINGIADWTSVIVWGRFEELTGSEKAEGMQLLIDKLGPQIELLRTNRSPRDVTPGRIDTEPQVDIVYCIHIEEKSGRFESGR